MSPFDLVPVKCRILAAGIALAAVAIAAGLFIRHVHQACIETGRAEVQARWDREKLRAQDVALQAQAAAREQEQSMAASVAAVATHYSQESARAQADAADLRRRLADGSVRLSLPAGTCAGGGAAAAPAGPAPGGADGAPADLPRATAADLLALADEADAVTRQLGACQAILQAERR